MEEEEEKEEKEMRGKGRAGRGRQKGRWTIPIKRNMRVRRMRGKTADSELYDEKFNETNSKFKIKENNKEGKEEEEEEKGGRGGQGGRYQ
jgi:hypothetical protein